MIKVLRVIPIVMLASSLFSQTESNQVVDPKIERTSFELTDEQLFTPQKPANGRPAIFASQADLEAKQAIKIEGIKQKLIANRNDPQMVNTLKEQLWRFENAVVASENK